MSFFQTATETIGGTTIIWDSPATTAVKGVGGFLTSPEGSAAIRGFQGIAEFVEGRRADSAARKAANLQARLTVEDAARAAKEEKIESERTRSLQRVLYLKSGVDISGSPLLILEQTRRKGAENAANVLEAGKARAGIIRAQGAITRTSFLSIATRAAGDIQNIFQRSEQLQKQLK